MMVNKNKKTILIILILGFLISFYFISQQIKTEKEFRKLTLMEELTARFKLADKTSDIQLEKNNVWWNNENGYSILVPSTDSFFVAKNNLGFIDDGSIPDIYFYKELAIVKKVFDERGFVLNKRNSSKDITDTSFYDYIQMYKKGDDLCSVSVSGDYSSYSSGIYDMAYSMSVSCGNTLKESQAEQIPFLDALEYKNKNNAVHIRNQSGIFFQVGVGGRRGGSTAILKKEGDTYRVLYISQEGPNCEEIDGENIPNETLSLFKIEGCWDGTNGFRRF